MNFQKTIYFLIVLLDFGLCYSQGVTSFETNIKNKSNHYTKEIHLSPAANLLSLNLKQGASDLDLQRNYNLLKIQENKFVPVLTKLSKEFNPETFKQYNIKVNTIAGDIYSIQIPLESYQQFIKESAIIYLELAIKTYSRLDKALKESKVDLVHQGLNLSQAYTGKDVVVGILDIGFDYTHPTFSNPKDGSSRIMRSWEQNFGNKPPNGFSYGSEFNQLEMLIEKKDFTDTGHGTHVTSVAAGSGGSLQDKYRGVAYESDIVLVSTNVLEGYNGLNTGIIDGMNYIFKYAESVGKPAVINISQGHHTGPHDGTSLTDQAIDAMTGPGRIVVGSAGNEGDPDGYYLHFDHNFEDENEILSYLVWPEGLSSGETDVEIWGDAGEALEVAIEIYNPKTKTQEAVSEFFTTENSAGVTSGFILDQENDSIFYVVSYEINPLNNRPHIVMEVNSTAQSKSNDVNFNEPLDNDFVQLRFRGKQGTVHAYAANNIFDSFFTDLSGIGADEFIDETRVLGGNSDYTIGELGGTAHSIISVGGFITKNIFTNTNNEQLGTSDDIADFYFRSSRGPTHDGRMKPDISAPAGWMSGAANSFNTFFNPQLEVDFIDKPGAGKWSFAVKRGTSFASPMVAGTVALLLEINPNLTPLEIKNLIIENSEQDNFTGTEPNNLWGYGKLNAYKLISALDIPTAIGGIADKRSFQIFPNPADNLVSVNYPNSEKLQLELFDCNGRLLYNKKLNGQSSTMKVDLSNFENGIYLLQLNSDHGLFQEKLIISK